LYPRIAVDVGYHHHYWHHSHRHWLLPALVGTVVGLGLFHHWH
jgi:hypothetical protein